MNYKLQTLIVRLICNPQDADFQAKLLQTLYASVCCLLSKIRVFPVIQRQSCASRRRWIRNPCPWMKPKGYAQAIYFSEPIWRTCRPGLL